jgi:hypothetical protein
MGPAVHSTSMYGESFFKRMMCVAQLAKTLRAGFDRG